jgi:hypothetical protein
MMKITVQAEPVSEYELQKLVCFWLRKNFPNLIFFSDLSGVPLHPYVAKKIRDLKCGVGIPDLWIIKKVGQYSGLVLEIKTQKNTPFIKNGSLSKNKHIQEQSEVLKKLDKEGFYTCFSVGYMATQKLISDYLADEL